MSSISTYDLTYMGTVARSTLDLVVGRGIADASEYIFKKSWMHLPDVAVEMDSNHALAMRGSRLWLQLLFTVLMSLSARSLYVNENSIDPLGGMMFMHAVNQQPTFWAKLTDFGDSVKRRLLYEVAHMTDRN